MATTGLQIQIGADVKDAQSGIRSINAELDRLQRQGKLSIGGLETSIKDFGKGLKLATNPADQAKFNLGIKAMTDRVKELKTAGLDAGSGLVSGFNKGFNALKQFANIIPGLGIAGLLGLAIGPLVDLFKNLTSGINSSAAAAKRLGETIAGAAKPFQEAFTNVESLRINIDLARKGFIDKEKVVKQFNETIGKTVGEVKNLDEAEASLIENGPAYIKMTLFKAAANIALEGAAKKAFEAEQARRKAEKDFLTGTDKAITGLGSLLDVEGGQASFERFEKARQQQAEKRKTAAVKAAQDESNALLDIANKFQADAAAIAKTFKFDIFGGELDDKVVRAKIKKAVDLIKNLGDKGAINIPVIIEHTDLEKAVNDAIETVNTRGLRKNVIDIAVNVPSRPLQLLKELREEEERTAAVVSDVLTPAFQDMFDAIAAGENPLKAFFSGLKQAVQQLIQQLIAAAIQAAVLSLITQGGANPISFIQAFKFPGFAEGGVVFGPTLAMIGEGSGTSRSNPEIVAPLDKLKGLIGKSGGNQRIGVDVRMRGRDLVGVNNREDRSQRRRF